jgi:hypothetical protein
VDACPVPAVRARLEAIVARQLTAAREE